jgi:integrase
MAALREVPGEPAAALEFAVLTAARSGEVMGATWGEFDLDKALWTVPANRMKGGREHRVPLSPRALELLRQRWHSEVSPSAYVFRGRQPGSGLSVMALAMVLRRMGDVEAGQEAPPWAGCTVHGFRSSFKDWTAEETNFGRELSEAALAHLVGDEVERAYRRGDALEKRRALMLAWERYCNGEPIENVVMLPRSAVA